MIPLLSPRVGTPLCVKGLCSFFIAFFVSYYNAVYLEFLFSLFWDRISIQ